MPVIATPRVRLDERRTMAFVLCVVLVVRQLLVWHWVQRRVLPQYHWTAWVSSLPKSLIWAVALAPVVTLLAKGMVALVLRPLVLRWHAPAADASMAVFQMGPGERIVAERGARRAGPADSGRRWRPGALVRTTHRVCFFPEAWDEEPWSLALGEAVGPALEPLPRFGLRLFRDWPDRFTVRDAAGAAEVFAVADPEAVLAWFGPPVKKAPRRRPARRGPL